MLKGVILDFDGVIIDSESIWYDIFNDWFVEKFDYDLSMDEFKVCVGSSSSDLFDSFDKRGMVVDRNHFNEATRTEFIEKSSDLPPMEGIVDLVKSTKEEGLKLVLVTSSTRPKPLFHLERLGLLEYFDELVTADLVERIKPFPDLYLKALELMGLEGSEVIAIEDSLNGFKSATEAGIETLVVPNKITKFETFPPEAKIFNSTADIKLSDLKG